MTIQDKSVFEDLRRALKARLSEDKRASLKKYATEPIAMLFRRNLRLLAQLYGSDKWGNHWYCQHYERHFADLRKREIVLLEIGIGGHDDPKSGGNSLRMWEKYFSRGRIYGVDIFDKSGVDDKRIRTFRGDQCDEEFLVRVIGQIGRPDIIIDDGSHVNSHVIKTFGILFPHLADHGIYVVEDTQTAYWPEFGGSSEDITDKQTSLAMLKGLTDCLNHSEFIRPGYEPSYFDKWIVALHFYHNLVFVHKGLNDEVGGGGTGHRGVNPHGASRSLDERGRSWRT